MRNVLVTALVLMVAGAGARSTFIEAGVTPLHGQSASPVDVGGPAWMRAWNTASWSGADGRRAAEAPATRPSTRPAVAKEDGSAEEFESVRGHEGYWRVGRDKTGVWWFVSPKGTREFLNAVTTVQPFQLGRDRMGGFFRSSDWHGTINADGAGAGDIDAWAQPTLERVKAMGFKSLGAWCNPVFHKYDIPMTRDINVSSWTAGIRFYSPEWKGTAERAIRDAVGPLRENKNLVGYYTDNELDWGDAAMGPAANFDGLASNDPSRSRVVSVIQEVWKTVAGFNADWKTSLASWGALEKVETLPREPSEAYSRLYTAWIQRVASDYFATTTRLVRKYDVNHLILGVRFRGYAPAPVVEASRQWTDAQSINIYAGDAKLDAQSFAQMHELSGGQPVIISEYAFHALDGRSGNRNTVGFAAQVLDQQARGDAYRVFTTRLARVPYVIGADWFQWMDEPAAGRAVDGEDVNFGVVDVKDKPYEALAAAVRETGPRLNGFHGTSAQGACADVWRENYSKRPAMTAPHLERAPDLDGDLAEWPVDSAVAGVRHSETVGLDRSPLPLPMVKLGWRDEGLYVGMEVFDRDVDAAPAKGWWWTKDCVEIWVNTRSTSLTQNDYDADSHEFFYVPARNADGTAGCVGQLHRRGDALDGDLVPHPAVKQATRIDGEKYVVEMLIPATALHGWDATHKAAMSFNVRIRNHQHATDYFWSAPREVMTQVRPSTWGTLNLGEANASAAAHAPATRPVQVTAAAR